MLQPLRVLIALALIPCFLAISESQIASQLPYPSARGIYRFVNSFRSPFVFVRGNNIPNWEYGGATVVLDEFVRLTPAATSKNGYMWNTRPLNFEHWSIEVKVSIGGPNRIGADGLGIWYVEQGQMQGPVYGSRDQWKGLGIFVDTFDNDRGRDNPSIVAVLNDGTKAYQHDRDGKSQALGYCMAPNLRYTGHQTHAMIRVYYQNNRLMVFVDANNRGNWVKCIDVGDVQLPKGYYLGTSAATGAITDNHDVYQFVTYSYEAPYDPNKPQQAQATQGYRATNNNNVNSNIASNTQQQQQQVPQTNQQLNQANAAAQNIPQSNQQLNAQQQRNIQNLQNNVNTQQQNNIPQNSQNLNANQANVGQVPQNNQVPQNLPGTNTQAQNIQANNQANVGTHPLNSNGQAGNLPGQNNNLNNAVNNNNQQNIQTQQQQAVNTGNSNTDSRNIADALQRITRLESALTSQTTKIDTLIREQTQGFAQLRQTVQQLQQAISNIPRLPADLLKRSDLQMESQNLHKSVSELSGAVATLKGDVSTMHNYVAQISRNVADTKQHGNNIAGEMRRNKQELAEVIATSSSFSFWTYFIIFQICFVIVLVWYFNSRSSSSKSKYF